MNLKTKSLEKNEQEVGIALQMKLGSNFSQEIKNIEEPNLSGDKKIRKSQS